MPNYYANLIVPGISLSLSPSGVNVIKLSIRALILEETLLKKGFFQAIFLKLLKVLGKGFKGKTLFQKGFPLNLMTLPLLGRGRGEGDNLLCQLVMPA
jgi:hypothetical protein